MRKFRFALALSACLCLVLSTAWADAFRLGNPQLVPSGLPSTPGGTFANGTFTTTGTIPSSTAPFGSNNPCGGDSNLNPPGNCNTSWTFTYAPYGGVSSATITLGLLGLDSADTGNQVALFELTNGGGFDFTNAFNLLSEGTNVSGRGDCAPAGTTLHNCPEYNIYMINITDPGALAALASGSATLHFTMSGPGRGPFGSTTYNGATLDFSELDITGSPVGPPPVPEPSSLILLATGALPMLRIVKRKLSR